MYIIMGASGQIGQKTAHLLLAQGERVRVLGRRAEGLNDLQRAGAEVVVGDAQDARFLTAALRGATAVFAMIPPNYAAPDFHAYQARFGEATVTAIVESGVTRVVNLSSIGGELPSGTGPIAGLHAQEERLNALHGVEVLHLRPGYFMENLLWTIPVIRQIGRVADLLDPKRPIDMIATRDIAAEVARQLVTPTTRGHAVQLLLGPRALTMLEVTAVLGAAAGLPGLTYQQITKAEAAPGMLAGGFSPNVVELFAEMNLAFSDGRIHGKRDATSTTPTSIEQFAAEEFTPAFAHG